MKVKICGVTNREDALICEDLGANMIGFVHLPGRERSLPISEISHLCSYINSSTKVLVCAPSDTDDALRMFAKSGADVLQSHSLEPEEIRTLGDHGVRVFRAVPSVRSEAVRYSEVAEALVFENGTPGTGTAYDYSTVPIDCCRKGIIAGGLTIENLHLAKALEPYALDVSSGVESRLGKKDPDLVAEFIRRCRR